MTKTRIKSTSSSGSTTLSSCSPVPRANSTGRCSNVERSGSIIWILNSVMPLGTSRRISDCSSWLDKWGSNGLESLKRLDWRGRSTWSRIGSTRWSRFGRIRTGKAFLLKTFQKRFYIYSRKKLRKGHKSIKDKFCSYSILKIKNQLRRILLSPPKTSSLLNITQK